MLDAAHLRDGVGDLDQLGLGPPSGHHHGELAGSVRERSDHLIEGQVLVAKSDVELIEDEEVIRRRLATAGLDDANRLLPAMLCGGDVLLSVLAVPGKPLAADDVLDLRKALERRLLSRLPLVLTISRLVSLERLGFA